MNQSEEKAYLRGERAAWCRVLQEAVKALGYDTPEGQLAALLKEREAAVAQLRQLCEDYGDNDWEDGHHLGDVVEKHLGRHLSDPSEDVEEKRS